MVLVPYAAMYEVVQIINQAKRERRAVMGALAASREEVS